jgi:cytochrome c
MPLARFKGDFYCLWNCTKEDLAIHRRRGSMPFDRPTKHDNWESFMRHSIGAARFGLTLLAATASRRPATARPRGRRLPKGKKVFAKCMACHTLEAGKNKVGPRCTASSAANPARVEGFTYSDAMKNSGSPGRGDAGQYLTSPKKEVPGNKMAFPGCRSRTTGQRHRLLERGNAMKSGASIRGFGAGFPLLLALISSFVATGSLDARADTTPLKISIGYIAEAIPEPDPLSLVEIVPKGQGHRRRASGHRRQQHDRQVPEADL